MRNKILVQIICFLTIGFFAFGQETFIASKFRNYAKNNLSEKIYVHTGKDFYMAGETIWFRIYATDATSGRFLNISKVCYVELINKENKAILQTKISMSGGLGEGSLEVPYGINSDVYNFRCYTAWMKNSSADYYFQKFITVVNPLRRPQWSRSDSIIKYDVQFFPEGGNLVTNIKSKVAFKISDHKGNGIDCSGFVLNKKLDTVLHFQTTHAGMGFFYFTPEQGETYSAGVLLTQLPSERFALPAVESKGYVIDLQRSDSNLLLLQIKTNLTDKSVDVIINNNNRLTLASSLVLVNGEAVLHINDNGLNEGISHITLFNEKHQPVCERLYFKKPEHLLDLNISAAASFNTRSKVDMELSSISKNQNFVPLDLSISVFKTDAMQGVPNTNIINYTWLQSELKGYIESPGLYFSNDPQSAGYADILMLTQGWRRFKWEDVLSERTTENNFLPELEGHLITGNITNKNTHQPADNITAILSVPSVQPLFNNSMSRNGGHLIFNMKNFTGSGELILQTLNPRDSFYTIEIANPFSDKFSSQPFPHFSVSLTYKTLLDQRTTESMVINNFNRTQNQHFILPVNMDTVPFYGKPTKRYYLDDYTRFITMEEVLKEFVADVRLRKVNNRFELKVRNNAFGDFQQSDPLILMDGVPVNDVNTLINFDPLKIRRIDVLAEKFYQNNLEHDGIISFNTYQGDFAGFPLSPNALVVEYEALQLQREFYSPKYESADLPDRKPDYRNQLFWSPDIKLHSQGKKTISFYTGDLSGKYLVVVEAIDRNGRIGYKNFSFMVNAKN